MSIESVFKNIVGATAEQLSLFAGSYVPGESFAHELMPEQYQGIDRRRALILTAVLLAAPGCVATVKNPIPREPYRGELPAEYRKAAQGIPHLIEETRQLPMIRDGLNAKDVAVLNDLAELINEDRKQFSDVFREMYQVGIPGKRDHNTPLETLCFLLEDGKYEDARTVIDDYSIDHLLARGWFKERELLSGSDAERIVSHIKDTQKRENYRQLFHRVDNAQFLEYVKDDAGSNLFDKNIKYVLDEISSRKQRYRWKDFYIVALRLNSPKLTQYYVNSRFNYNFQKNRVPQTPKETFQESNGVCRHFSTFVVHCLSKSGYDSGGYKIRNVTASGIGWKGHTVAAMKNLLDEHYIIMDSNNPREITGPFSSFTDIAHHIFGNPLHINVETNSQLYSRILRVR